MFPLPRTRTGRALAAIGVLAAAVVIVWPLTSALPLPETIRIRVVCVAVTSLTCVAVGLVSPRRRWTLDLFAIVSALAAVGMLAAAFQAQGICLAHDDEGRPVVIGSEYTARGREYLGRSPATSVDDLLLDVGLQPDIAWTPASIARCRVFVGWIGPLAIPLLAAAAALVAVRSRGSYALVAPASSAPAATAAAASSPVRRYDAFISYRRLDRERAERLTEEIEARGYRVAIDFRDFRPNEPAIVEMERCILESRFVLCVITADYNSSGFTNEEALMTRLVDLTERRNRIVPLVFERVPLPLWLQELVGINFMSDAQIDPIEKLMTLLESSS